jgi:competence protein ComEA
MARLLAFLLLLCMAWPVLASADLNTANEAELDSVKGLGPSSTARILSARAQGPFSDWADFMHRVKGVKPATARKLSQAGATVNGAAFEPAPTQAKVP